MEVMKKIWKSMPLMFGIIMLILALTSGSIGAEDNVIYVDANVDESGDGSSWDQAFKDLQEALDLAVDGYEIWVAAGTYYPSNPYVSSDDTRYNSFVLKSGVGIYGGFTGSEEEKEQRDPQNNETILNGKLDDSTQVYHVVYGNGVSDGVLDGFTVTGGYATGMGVTGGGINLIGGSMDLSNLVVKDNVAEVGGGIYFNVVQAELQNIRVINNNASDAGAGMAMNGAYVLMSNSVVSSNNSKEDAGGIDIDESIFEISKSSITGNSAAQLGGGINAVYSKVLIENTFIKDNSANKGGGLAFELTDIMLYNTLVAENHANEIGGGIYEVTNQPAPASLSSNVSIQEVTYIPGIKSINTTISNNNAVNNGIGSGVVLSLEGDHYAAINTIIWGNGNNNLEDNIIASSVPSFPLNVQKYILSSNIVGGFNGVDLPDDIGEDQVKNKDPKFIDMNNGNYQLSSNSVDAIDVGLTDLSLLNFMHSTSDLDGEKRIVNEIVDLGAYEYLGESEPNPVPEIYIKELETHNMTKDVIFSTPYDEIELPETVKAILSNEEEIDIPIDWEDFSDRYNPTELRNYEVWGDLVLPDNIQPYDYEIKMDITIIDNYIIQVDVEREVAPGKTYKIEGKDGKLTKSSITMPSDMPEDTRILVEGVNLDLINTGTLVNVGDIFKITVDEPEPNYTLLTASTETIVIAEQYLLTLGYGKDANPDSLGGYYYNTDTNSLELKSGEVDKVAGTISINVSKPHSDIYGVFQEPIEVVPIEEPDKEEPIEEPKEEPKESGKKLPDTATSNYNWLFIGLSLLLIGGTAYFLSRRKMA